MSRGDIIIKHNGQRVWTVEPTRARSATMTNALPDPTGCVWCGQPAYRNASSCIECGAALAGEMGPGSVVRNVTFDGDCVETRGPILRTPLGTVYRNIYRNGRVVSAETLFGAKVPKSVVEETARERRVHDGGPRIKF